MRTLLFAQQLQRALGAQHRAPQVHEDQHAILAVNRLDGLLHLEGIGADGVFGIGRAAGSCYTDPSLPHLPRQVAHTLSQLGAVRDHNDPDHERHVSAAAFSSR